MLDGDILQYMQTASGLIAELPANKIYLAQAPNTAVMPWLIIDILPGIRDKIAQDLTEQISTVRVTVEVGPDQKVKGRTIAEKALRALDNYRGAIYTTNDVHITCGSIGLTMGLNYTHRYSFNARVRFAEAFTTP